MQNSASEEVIKTLKQANCVLVTVKNSPSVDELTAAIGLTLILNHMGKHAVTVFSGYVPSTLEFLQPETAIDTNTDSLRDFIIALDKAKADKLRYKVEDNVVRIFITPYKASISEKDLEFSQGEFNVDVVVGLGVIEKEDFDQAVTTHGRILHDATVITVTAREGASDMGAINWHDQQASGVSEMVASIADQLSENALDGQIATALMTGMVAETDRFKNSYTTPQVLSLSARLLSAGANQQLIAEKLEQSAVPEPLHNEEYYDLDDGQQAGSPADGTLEISHDDETIQNIEIDDDGNLQVPEEQHEQSSAPLAAQEMVAEGPEPPQAESHRTERTYMEPAHSPRMFGQDDSGTVAAQPLFTAADAVGDDASTPHTIDGGPADPAYMAPRAQKVLEPLDSSAVHVGDVSSQTLTEIEASVSTAQGMPVTTPEPVISTSVDDFLGGATPSVHAPEQVDQPDASPEASPATQAEEHKEEQEEVDPNAPPVVPPPLLPQAPAQPQFFDADGNNQNPFLNPPK